MNKPLIIDYYTDLLCVWAWIAQRRIEELKSAFGEAIELRHRYMDIFGDSGGKIPAQWAERESYQGFCQHVVNAAAPFKDAPVNSSIWSQVRPATSANAHLLLKAVELACGKQQAIATELTLRRAFFVDAVDIGHITTLLELLQQQNLDVEAVRQQLDSGAAMASLMGDYQQARLQGIKGSPSYVLDNGRQVLYGNVGYRVLHANIEELLNKPDGEASWC
ncbi:MAG: DsbA family protein [Porticoccaceae bacterium]|nr:DsbA family protein [Porticoccaceae bacterium]